MHSPSHAWCDIPVSPKEHHRTFCLEYPRGIINGSFVPSDPACVSGDSAVTGPKALFVVLPGNPGLANFYENFARHLLQHRFLEGLAVIVPSHAGFSMPSREHHHHGSKGHHHRKQGDKHQHHDHPHEHSENIDDTKGPFLLDHCLLHLKSFFLNTVVPIIERFSIPPDRAWICGHSIGAFFAINTLDAHEKISSSFGRVVLLAPTIAGMASSSNGAKMKNFLHYGKYFVPQLAGVLHSAFRTTGVHGIIEMTVGRELHASDCHVVKQMIGNTRITKQVMHLASDELKNVNEVPPVLAKIQDRVICFFCYEDEWVPPALREQIRRQHPNLAAFHICEHREVLHNWTLRCDVVANFIGEQFAAMHYSSVTTERGRRQRE